MEAKQSSPAVVILGAGATRGASTLRRPIRPPLDADFFSQLMRFRQGDHECVDQVLRDVPKLCGSAHNTTLEQYFSLLAAMPEVMSISPSDRFKERTRKKMIRYLTKSVAVLLKEALQESDDQHLYCKHHDAMVNALRAGDSILTFNYDCTVDWALKQSGKSRWNPMTGYGIQCSGSDVWATNHKVQPESPIRLLKMHGSLHFKWVSEQSLDLWPTPFRSDKEDFMIIPPVMSKKLGPGFVRIWKSAAESIFCARRLCVVGYSLPATDLTALALLRCNLRPGHLENLTIVNPSREVCDRLYSVLSYAVGRNTRVVFNRDFAEFSDQGCPGLWNRT